MKLYYAKGACSLAARVIIHELNIPCEFEAVNLQTKKTATGADFLTINPKGVVPVLLLDDGQFLTENAAIQQYLADEHNAIKLLPATSNFRRYRVLEWLTFVSTDLHKGCGPLFNPKLPQQIKDEIFIPILKNKITLVDQHLSRNKYLLDEQFTLADAYLFVILSWLPHFHIELANWPNIVRYFNELKSRPSIQKSLQEEGLQI